MSKVCRYMVAIHGLTIEMAEGALSESVSVHEFEESFVQT